MFFSEDRPLVRVSCAVCRVSRGALFPATMGAVCARLLISYLHVYLGLRVHQRTLAYTNAISSLFVTLS